MMTATITTMPAAQLAGASAFDGLLAQLSDLANATCDRFGDDVDGIDYAGAAMQVQSAIATHLAAADPGYRSGFLRGLADVLVTASLGNSLGEGWRAVDLPALDASGRRV